MSTGGMAETDATIANFIAQTGITFPILRDDSVGSYNQWATGPKITPYPVDVVIDQTGNVAFVKAEYDVGALVSAIQATL